MQGHFSIYCRLFPPGASSNSLRNLLEVSCNIFHIIIYLRNLLESTLVALTANIEKSGGKKDLDAMEINEIHKKEGKNLWYYQICTGKGFKNKAKTHNTVDCYDKPGNKNKCPHKTSSQKLSPSGPSKNKNQSFRAWLIGGKKWRPRIPFWGCQCE